MLKKTDKEVSYSGYVHLQSYEPEGVLSLVDPDAKAIVIEIKGSLYRIKVASLRLQCFSRSRVCVNCGLEGTIISADTFISTSDRDSVHFNLYAISEGKTRLMTKDHIMHRSKGGADHMDNFQTMCDRCNNKKGNELSEEQSKCITTTANVALFGDTMNIKIGE